MDDILTLDQEKLKFAKRKLRIQRCKVVTTSAAKKPKVTDTDSNAGISSRPNTRRNLSNAPVAPVAIPKGDPALGSRLAGLSKQDRKTAKAQDSERVARRLAKKKARNAMESSAKGSKAKKRVRERKEKKDRANPGKKEGKKRIRSEKSVQRKNIKK